MGALPTFELAELKALLQFYQGPLGRRLLEAQPNLTRESMQLGQRWGARVGADVGQQLAAEGVQIQPYPNPESAIGGCNDGSQGFQSRNTEHPPEVE